MKSTKSSLLLKEPWRSSQAISVLLLPVPVIQEVLAWGQQRLPAMRTSLGHEILRDTVEQVVFLLLAAMTMLFVRTISRRHMSVFVLVIWLKELVRGMLRRRIHVKILLAQGE